MIFPKRKPSRRMPLLVFDASPCRKAEKARVLHGFGSFSSDLEPKAARGVESQRLEPRPA